MLTQRKHPGTVKVTRMKGNESSSDSNMPFFIATGERMYIFPMQLPSWCLMNTTLVHIIQFKSARIQVMGEVSLHLLIWYIKVKF